MACRCEQSHSPRLFPVLGGGLGLLTGRKSIDNTTCRGTRFADSLSGIFSDLDPWAGRAVDIDAVADAQHNGHRKSAHGSVPFGRVIQNAAEANQSLSLLVGLVLLNLSLAEGGLQGFAVTLHLRSPSEPCQRRCPAHSATCQPVDLAENE